VSIAQQRYKGFTPYKMDPKFRVSIPTAWRPEAGAPLFLLFSTAHQMPLVKVLTQEAFDARVKVLNDSDYSPARKSALLGSLSMLSREATLNDQGKLLIPKDLSEKAEIFADSEVMLAGRGMHFEIWSKENFDRALEIEMQQCEDDDLGIL
jgi:MraZ protein